MTVQDLTVELAGIHWNYVTVSSVSEAIESLERRIEELRAAVRKAVMAGDRTLARSLRAELRRLESEWDEALAEIERLAAPPLPVPHDTALGGSLLPIREQVHQALTLLSVPAAPKLITAVHEAFFAGEMVAARLTSLRRDEERSFRSAPFARPYYLCAALSADLLAPARGLLAVSTWALHSRVIGPLSPRTDFLTAAVCVAEHLQRQPGQSLPARRLLWRFASNIPGGADTFESMDPLVVVQAAMAELEIHADADRASRQTAADRARRQLDHAGQLFGTQFRGLAGRASGA
jgi:hypothetical protein